ncbi:hypothetical protein, partial [Burkholderia sp. Tr-860]|uniref:hypothetical protein n=2 Tax=unclassified Burkholderia TaxID=2613784 RepID=UPI00196615D3
MLVGLFPSHPRDDATTRRNRRSSQPQCAARLLGLLPELRRRVRLRRAEGGFGGWRFGRCRAVRLLVRG